MFLILIRFRNASIVRALSENTANFRGFYSFIKFKGTLRKAA